MSTYESHLSSVTNIAADISICLVGIAVATAGFLMAVEFGLGRAIF